ncbi:uncharacterized protein LOC110451382 [Mizuhopecten yessoensis]|uniref:Uncharacterized protein n=1 Tax=Mizuhopecten yessoensis TaxID=6573 RepID=A0A210QLS3_MIZYE|nr:uncharacterized protein LOC110451382 [Mizuhopecten yessoensis]OWF49693.1 hypothetical protein KP79_PYT03985 [Mizuhopecten yessoensis]
MAAAVVRKTDVGVKEFGRDVDVAEVPQAKLMYYLDSICYALNLDKSESGVRKLREYRKYRELTNDDIDELLILCTLFSPDVLLGKCIFMDEDMCGNNMNKFYELNAVSNKMLITEEIVIAGQTRQVLKILCFRKIWLECFYIEPLAQFKERLGRIAGRISGRQGGGGGEQRRARPQTSTRPTPVSGGSASANANKKDSCAIM